MALLDVLSTSGFGSQLPTILTCVAVLFLVRAVFQAQTGPLASLPGPEISKWTDLHVRLMLILGKRAQYVHSLHQKYGPVVRVGPNDVDVSDHAAAREIHRAKGGFLKSSFYATGGRIQSMFSTRDRGFHSSRRRLLGPCFTETSLENLQPVVVELTRTAMRKMRDEAKAGNGTVDLLKWWTLLAMDVIGQLSFGESFGMVESGKKSQFAEDVSNAGAILPLRTAFPTLIWIGAYLPLPFFQNIAQSRQRIVAYNQERVARYMQLVQKDAQKSRATIFTSLIKGNAIELTELELTVEVQSYITAGTDTTAVTLTYLIWAVCRDQKIRDELVRELKSVDVADEEQLTYKHVRDLPYLNCVVEEALRRYGAAPGALPRDVPDEGAFLGGHFVPGGGTVVSTQGYSLHRDPELFPDPERFNPSRWENPTKEMRDAFMAFGTGPRGCIGVHLARMELRLATALFFRSFPSARVSTKDGMSDTDMDELITFLLVPRGHRCLVELE
ncbi:cytochrome P450 [Apodospora peruviana]|uniref:Cytochrome P450 n=1 Tax=Apodospora peruviana TaxID=516989 RepID=A0AAE0IGZ8_9PEZI|nr:cytochrome P450 [Apodospora peruviana]